MEAAEKVRYLKIKKIKFLVLNKEIPNCFQKIYELMDNFRVI